MGRIAEFYAGSIKHRKGFSIEDVWQGSAGSLEFAHTYIQWLFPLPEMSAAQPSSPILTDGDIRRFAADADLQARLRRSFHLMLGFYGFELSCDDGRLLSGKHATSRSGRSGGSIPTTTTTFESRESCDP